MEVKDVYVDSEEWEVTHLEIQLTKEAALEILGAKTAIRNMLAIKALGKGSDCCTERGIEIGVSKPQLHISVSEFFQNRIMMICKWHVRDQKMNHNLHLCSFRELQFI